MCAHRHIAKVVKRNSGLGSWETVCVGSFMWGEFYYLLKNTLFLLPEALRINVLLLSKNSAGKEDSGLGLRNEDY